MSYRETVKILAGMKDRGQALVLNRFLKNLYRLFDNHPPQKIEREIDEIIHAVDSSKCQAA